YELKSGTLSFNYNITVVKGTLTVTEKTDKVTVKITGHTGEYLYDGTAKTVTGYDVEISNPLYTEADFTFKGTDSLSETDAGTYNMNLAADQFTNISKNITNVEFVIVSDGELVINPRKVTLTSNSKEKVYDGTALEDATVTVTGDGFVEGEVTDVKATGTITEVGSVTNTIEYKTGTNFKAGNYEITKSEGTLKVTKKAVTITADSATKVYDGTALTKNTYTSEGLAAGDKVESVTVTGSQTVVGKSDNVPSAAKIVNAKGEDVTASYEITYANGSLEVTKAKLTITADSATKVYDGTALTKNSYTNTVVAEGDTIAQVIITGSQTEVGKSDNVPSAAKIVNSIGDDVTACYEIEYKNGTLEVTRNNKPLVIKSSTKSWTYDGTVHTDEVYTVTFDGTELTADESGKVFTLPTGDKLTITATAKGVKYVADTADKNNTYEYELTNAAGYANVTAEFGTLSITPAKLTITADSDAKVYDGTALTKDTYKSEGLVGGDKVDSVTVTGSQTAVGKSDNVPSAAEVVDAKGEDVTANYEITYVKGSLEVTKREIVVKVEGKSDTVVYDGEEHKVEGYDLSSEDELFDEANVVFEGEAIAKGTEPGEYEMGLTEDKFSYDDDNFTVTFEVTDGKLTINAPEKVSYKVEHYLQNLEDNGFTLKETEELTGKFNEVVKAVPKEYEGFTFDNTIGGTVEEGVLKVDGQLVLKLYYTRDTYEIRYKLNGGIYDGSTEDIVEYHKYGEVITIHEAPTREGYKFDYWEGSKHYPGDAYTVVGDHVFTAQWILSDIPETSDASNMALWLASFGVSVVNSLGLAYVAIKKRKEEEF
ncbi:MAG: InlB B-repeat-containing protein, partial [Erysipelotrichaceae bacterium]|nr:InlB B-repeat-containing protein [Erysipelotrichaceae bacterium]